MKEDIRVKRKNFDLLHPGKFSISSLGSEFMLMFSVPHILD
jgi:hypothetical protein